MSVVRADLFPKYRQAGLKKEIKDQSTGRCLQPENRNIQTPQQIYRYRKSYKEQSGVTIKHYGTVRDQLPEKKHTYGVQTQKSEGVKNIMNVGSKVGVVDIVNDIQQNKYASLKKQPLGFTIDRKYNLPQDCKKQQFKYGLSTIKDEYDAKQTIFLGDNMPQKQQIRQMYLKSHQDYNAGQQKQRQYNWNIQPTDFRFGKVEKNYIHNQIKQVLSPQCYNENFPQTKFIHLSQNDYMNKKHDQLGKSSNLGQKKFPQDHVFGVRIQPNAWNAGKCIKGQSNQYDVRADDDLGKSKKIGCRNIIKQGDNNRLFGLPTIRYDIKKPQKQSMADPNNYADQTTLIELLFPKQFTQYGINDDDFNKCRSKLQIKEIFQNIGFSFKNNIFQTIFQRSKVIHGTILDRVSCSSFKKSLYQMCAH